MTAAAQAKDIASRKKELRSFGFILAGGIMLLFGLLFPLLRDGCIHLASWPWMLAPFLVLVSLAAPMLLGPLNRGWLFIGDILGYVNTRIILGVIFLVIFTPYSFIMKLLKVDPMQRRLVPEQESYRINSKQPKNENLNRPY
jgi:hypothetical protein